MAYDTDRPPNRTDDAIGVIVKGYPRLSETFIAQELRALEERGLSLRIYSLRHPYDTATHPIHADIHAPVVYLPEYLRREPGRVARGWRAARRMPGFRAAKRMFLRDLRRDRTRNRVRRFGQACVLAAELAPEVSALYAHFMHTPASVARYVARICGRSFAVSAHAKDIWTTPVWDLAEKAADAAWITTCTEAGATYLRGQTCTPEKVRIAPHGLDLRRFTPAPAQRPAIDGTDREHPVTLLSVGRLVEKKGYDTLLSALTQLPRDLHWRFVHIGRGEMGQSLVMQARRLSLTGKIEWLGPQTQTTVLEWLRRADLFVLASRVAADGDRDGLPNVLMEAQSQALACVAAATSAIPELIENGTTGLLVPPNDAAALATALERMIRNPDRRLTLGRAGERRVRAEFSMTAGADDLAHWLADLSRTRAAT